MNPEEFVPITPELPFEPSSEAVNIAVQEGDPLAPEAEEFGLTAPDPEEEITEEDLNPIPPEAPPALPDGIDPNSFYDNLAIEIEEAEGESVLSELAYKICDAVDQDLSDRSQWKKMLDKGLKLLGIEGDDIPDKPFETASTVFSSAPLEACLQFIASARAELLPPKNLVKIENFGTPEDETIDQGKRVEEFMNFFLTRKCPEFYSEMEKTFFWTCLAGNGYVKVYQDPLYDRPTVKKVLPTNIVVPESAASLETASRIVEKFDINEKELMQRQQSGLYRDIDLVPNQGMDDQFEDRTLERIDGVEGDPGSLDDELNKTYSLYEAHIDLDLIGHEDRDPQTGEPTGIPLPYIVTIDIQSKRILSIYRNWEIDDPTFTRLNYYVKFTYIPGLGFSDYGIAQLTSSQAEAAALVTRQVLDLNTLNNFPGGFRSKGVRAQSNVMQMNPGEFVEVDTGGQPINQVFQLLPFRSPSPLSMDLKNTFEESIKRLSATINLSPENLPANMSATSTLAMVEKTTESQTAVIQRFHRSLGEIFKIMGRLFRHYLPPEPYQFLSGPDNFISPEDFSNELNIVPVSDANLTSRVQRLVRNEALMTMANEHPELHNFYELYKRIYRDLKIDNIDAILPPPQDAVPRDPITENANIILGQPVKAGMDQDHEAHIAVHSALLNDPQGSPEAQGAAQAHINEHRAQQYLVQMQSQLGIELPQDGEPLPMELQNQIAVQAAQLAQQQMGAEGAEEQPQDPMMLQAQAMMQQNEVKAEENRNKMELELIKLRAQEEREKLDSINKVKELELKEMEAERKQKEDYLKEIIELYKSQLQFLRDTGMEAPSLAEVTGVEMPAVEMEEFIQPNPSEDAQSLVGPNDLVELEAENRAQEINPESLDPDAEVEVQSEEENGENPGEIGAVDAGGGNSEGI